MQGLLYKHILPSLILKDRATTSLLYILWPFFFYFHPLGKKWMSPSQQQLENKSLRKELTVFPADSQSEAFPFLIAVILYLFLCLLLNREANMICSVYTLYGQIFTDQFGFSKNIHKFLPVEAFKWERISIYKQFPSDQIFSENTIMCFL